MVHTKMIGGNADDHEPRPQKGSVASRSEFNHSAVI
jgi:hypothetical protein